MPASHLDQRLSDIQQFYHVLDELERRVGGKRTLAEAHGHMDWPNRGVYFFFKPDEQRTTSGTGPRVTRVGTHALKAGSKSTLWRRLAMHRGTLGGSNPGGGNHRGSVFRLHVGTALKARDNWPDSVASQWGAGSSAKRPIREREHPLERAVSDHIRRMPFLWLAIGDDPGPNSLRGYIERNSIALLSNYTAAGSPIDPPSRGWLGLSAANDAIRRSGLWNVNHVGDSHEPTFLDLFERQLP